MVAMHRGFMSFVLTVVALFLVYSGVALPLSLAGVVMLRRKRSPLKA